jgi:hypothetical protein
MGARAVFRIYSDDHDGAFWANWASPQYKFPALARWIEACRWRGQIPTAENYWQHVQVDPDDQFTETFPVDDLDPTDLDYRYELRSESVPNGWYAELTVWTRRRVPLGGFEETHRAVLSSVVTAPIHQLAADGVNQILARTDSRANPDNHLLDWVRGLRRCAATHTAYAAISEHSITLHPQGTR